MKLWIVILPLIFLTVKNTYRSIQEDRLIFEVILKTDSIDQGKIYLKFSNRTERKLLINDPKYCVNARLTLLSEGEEIPTSIKIKIDVSNSSEYVEILPNSEYITEFSYNINYLYNFKSNGDYELWKRWSFWISWSNRECRKVSYWA